MNNFPLLFSPGKIGRLLIKNRVVMPAMVSGLASPNGEVTPAMLDYYEARAKGGAGLIIVEVASVDPPVSKQGFYELYIDHPRFLAGLNELAEVIHAHQARAFIQLFHAGRQTTPEYTQGQQAVAPSPIPCRVMRTMPRQLSEREIYELVQKFIRAAVHAKMAGFDGVEIHAAHGYLLSEFLSPYTNRRNDRYGGSLENRMRILLEIIDGIHNALNDFPISVRFNACDFIEGGITLEEGIEIARRLEKAGVDALNVSSGIYESGLTSIEPASYAEGWRMYLAEAVKKAVHIPVLGGGVIRTPQFAEAALQEGKADFIFIGRSLLADPEWPRKAQEGKLEDIIPCISCNTCINRDFSGLHIRCAVNPLTGRETRFRLEKPPAQKLRALVIGSGPAGLQAAIALSRRGHEVEIIEKDEQLGGLLNLAEIPPHKQRLKLFKEYLINQVKKMPIKISLNTVATPELIRHKKPDAVVLATGSVPVKPRIQGLEQISIYSIEDILKEPGLLKNKKVMVAGGGRSGCEVAEVLAEQGNQVTIVEMKPALAGDMEKKNRRDLLDRLKEHRVQTLTLHQVEAVENGQVIVCSLTAKEKKAIPADALVWAGGYTSHNSLYQQITPIVPRVFVVGDASQVRGIEAAIFEGEMVAYSL